MLHPHSSHTQFLLRESHDTRENAGENILKQKSNALREDSEGLSQKQILAFLKLTQQGLWYPTRSGLSHRKQMSGGAHNLLRERGTATIFLIRSYQI